MSSYIVLKNIKVNRINMMQSPYLYAPVPVFSSVCAGHKMGCVLGCEIDGVGIIHHKAEPLIEKLPEIAKGNGKNYLKNCPIQFRGAPSGEKGIKNKPISLSLQPTITAHIEISLVFKIPGVIFSIEEIKNASRALRISGGTISDIKDYQICVEDTLIDALSKVNNGFWIEDAMDVVEQRIEEGYDPVSAVFSKMDKGWFIPANLGFCAISEFKNRKGGRALIKENKTCVKVKNAFADNMVGLVKYRPFFEVKKELLDGGSINLWNFSFIDNSFYVVKQ